MLAYILKIIFAAYLKSGFVVHLEATSM